jgi:hypothetical protein
METLENSLCYRKNLQNIFCLLYNAPMNAVTLLQQLINGLSLGSLYALIAIGYTIMELPPKENGRPGFHESAILLPRQGKAGTTLPSCLAPSGLPCLALFQARPWKTTN